MLLPHWGYGVFGFHHFTSTPSLFFLAHPLHIPPPPPVFFLEGTLARHGCRQSFPLFSPRSPPLSPFFLAKVGYAQLNHHDVLDGLYDWEEDLQESLEAAAKDLATDPVEEDEDVREMEGKVQEEHTTSPAKVI